jgi:hypothetical protein
VNLRSPFSFIQPLHSMEGSHSAFGMCAPRRGQSHLLRGGDIRRSRQTARPPETPTLPTLSRKASLPERPKYGGLHEFLRRAQMLSGVISRVAHAPVTDQGRAGTEVRATAGTRSRCRDTASWRASSPVRAARRLKSVVASRQILPCEQFRPVPLLQKRLSRSPA